MQFIKNGPDIPERLLQAHEDGQVVFFCGAGVSYPAGLPGFSRLVNQLYQELLIPPNSVQASAIKAKQFDTAINLLEENLPGGRNTVRKQLTKILTPNLTTANATATHKALLTLAQNRENRIRLITTNFDRIFEEIKKEKNLEFTSYKAPLLPIPKNHWDGLVYLHGLLPEAPTEFNLNQLVLSSGDFGLAYLTERWASRFVSELFRNFTVCFIGYSINDPVLRYMMDALAADRLKGEKQPEMFAFGSYSKGKQNSSTDEWKAKNVTPILYPEYRCHSYLHKTLNAWARTYHDGVRGKEQIVTTSATIRPLASTKQDHFIGRMLWALSDPSGLPAKRFAELDPVPPLEWLEPLSQKSYGHTDLKQFGIPPLESVDDKLAYSLINRPTPYSLAPRMTIINNNPSHSQWDAVMEQLALWLIRHIGDPVLLHSVISSGWQLHDRLSYLIKNRLDYLDELIKSGRIIETHRILENAPNAIPGKAIRTLWRLLLSKKIKLGPLPEDLYSCWSRLKNEELCISVRLAINESLRPCVLARKPYAFPTSSTLKHSNSDANIDDIANCEVVLSSEHAHSFIQERSNDVKWKSVLPALLNDFNALLRDALDLMRELGSANDHKDPSIFAQPSIAEHPQNNDFYDWTVLIELTRNAWLATAQKSPKHAKAIAELWMYTPYPVFKRLAFFTATQQQIISLQQSLDWLLADEHLWLWSPNTKRETIRLLTYLAPKLEHSMKIELEQAILAGPPKPYSPNTSSEALQKLHDHDIWLRLAKITHAGFIFSSATQKKFDTISTRYPSWKLAENESDEFAMCTSDIYAADHAQWGQLVSIPRTIHGTLTYLLKHHELQESEQDDWRELCSERFYASTYALHQLAKKNIWPTKRWRVALQAWAEKKLHKCSWLWMAPVIAQAPNQFIQELQKPISWWLQAVAKTIEGHDGQFIALTQRLLLLSYEEEDECHANDLIFQAINHPVGDVTQACLDRWLRQQPDDEQGLPRDLKSTFTMLFDTKAKQLKYGRVILSMHMLVLFRVDAAWSKQHLLPLLDWKLSEKEAQAAWTGYLSSPRLYRPLIEAIKPYFLDTASHYNQLNALGNQFAAVLTFAALDLDDIFTRNELSAAFETLPEIGIRESSKALARALEGAGDQREDYWKNRVLPFWKRLWPKSNNKAKYASAEALARLCIAAGNEFPSARTEISPWLRKVDSPDYVIRKLNEANLAKRFPKPTLQFLSTIMVDPPRYNSREPRQCLDEISRADPDLRNDSLFKNLDELIRSVEG